MSESRKRKHSANEAGSKRTKSNKMPKPTASSKPVSKAPSKPSSKPPSKPSSKPPSQPTPTPSPLPVNWPPSLPYLTTPTYSPRITPHQLTLLRTPDPSLPLIPESFPLGPAAHVRITPITDPKHPAFTQSGLFATHPLPPGSLILPYIGHYHPGSTTSDLVSDDDDDDHSKSDYDLWLSRTSNVAVDAAKAGNEARYINDYRGIPFTPPAPTPGRKTPKQQKGRPNAEFRVGWDERRGERVMGVWVLPRGKKGLNTGIKRGEEVLVSYGRGFWEGRKKEEDDGEGEEGEQNGEMGGNGSWN
ncbi:hypothetical protein QBC41DRAFT_398240 [Cercophora samala]|uniref:SET domain-containing protein n=1 Tax=Cercophora samala TaxID=330535 RepID=A0AA40DGQ3_9PEZI|nr:hypothetical protein QBC41DRAFT_398240 [Cercophora samala]